MHIQPYSIALYHNFISVKVFMLPGLFYPTAKQIIVYTFIYDHI